MKQIFNFLRKDYHITGDIYLSLMDFIILAFVLLVVTIALRIVFKLLSKNLPEGDKRKFSVAFGYVRWLVYVVIILITFHSVGIPVTGIFAASAALMIGIGLALQTLFKDIISGIFILIDQSVHVGDIIEIDGKVGRVEEIKLRTTRAVTRDKKVLVIPNHLYLENSLFNWTQRGRIARGSVEVGVAYGSDVQLVKKLLLQAVKNQQGILETPEPVVLFSNFGDNSLDFTVSFSLSDTFNFNVPQSDVRFEIERLFREHNIDIPFPQREVRIVNATDGPRA
ncbi:MAG TPA: mechanosensitive ion channel [Aquaticitalea sp.]|nr:mechanosensitive ion channel [Aquaticitalea sp.]HNU60417.1 mechanosensitive ion channel [Aquaticitalea sp.]